MCYKSDCELLYQYILYCGLHCIEANAVFMFVISFLPVLGLDGVINTMGRIVSPLIMGDLYRRYGATAAFGTASAAVFLSSSIALLRRFFVARSQRRLAE